MHDRIEIVQIICKSRINIIPNEERTNKFEELRKTANWPQYNSAFMK